MTLYVIIFLSSGFPLHYNSSAVLRVLACDFLSSVCLAFYRSTGTGFPISRFINTGHKSDLTSTGGTHHRTKESVVIALSRIILENNKTEKQLVSKKSRNHPPPWEKKKHIRKSAPNCAACTCLDKYMYRHAYVGQNKSYKARERGHGTSVLY